MCRPPLEVADLVRAAGRAFVERNGHWLSWEHRPSPDEPSGAAVPPHSAAISISVAAAGIAPSLTTPAGTGTARSVRAVPATVGSKHVARSFCRRATCMWSSLFLVSLRHWPSRTKKSSTTSCFGAVRKHSWKLPRSLSSRCRIGFFSVLHTWNQKLGLHPHVHCVVPAGADSPPITPAGSKLIMPSFYLSRFSVASFAASLWQLSSAPFATANSGSMESSTLLAQPKTFSSWLRKLFRNDWVVYSKRPFGGPEHVLHYLRPLHSSRSDLQ